MEDRDVSEQIALGVPAKKTGDGLFDQRLFGENKGMDSGFDRKYFLEGNRFDWSKDSHSQF